MSQRFTEEFNGSLAVSHSKRDGSSFHWTDQLNLISPLHMADRERDKVGLNLDWSPSERLSLQAQLAQTKDDYDPNGLRANATSNGAILLGTGVKDGRANLFTLDGAFTLNDDWKLTAWYSMDETKAKQYMYQATTAVTFARADPIRKANLKDMGESFGFGMKGKAMANLDIGADVQWTRSEAQYQQSNVKDAGATLNEVLPNIVNKSLRLAINGVYQLDKARSLRIDLIHDRFETNDWTWMQWNSTTTAKIPFAYNGDGTTFTASNNQSANFLSVRYIYKFQ